jgi:hypothetical protein
MLRIPVRVTVVLRAPLVIVAAAQISVFYTALQILVALLTHRTRFVRTALRNRLVAFVAWMLAWVRLGMLSFRIAHRRFSMAYLH